MPGGHPAVFQMIGVVVTGNQPDRVRSAVRSSGWLFRVSFSGMSLRSKSNRTRMGCIDPCPFVCRQILVFGGLYCK